MSDLPLTPGQLEKVQDLFPQCADEIIGILMRDCGYNMPDLYPGREHLLERVRTAVLTISRGSKEKLLWAIEAAKVDWRDVLYWTENKPNDLGTRPLFRP